MSHVQAPAAPERSGTPLQSRSDTPTPSRSDGALVLYFAGLILMAMTLRHAVTGVSPLLGRIGQDVALGATATTLLGMLPTLAFGLAGFVAPAFVRRYGPAPVAVAAMVLGALGTIVRVLGDSTGLFLVFGALALFGMGIGNVVGPPLVKKYFGDRQAAGMTVLTIMTQAGATLPAMLALPVADAAGWRVAVGWYAVVMLVAALPWVLAAVRTRQDAAAATTAPAPAQSFGLRMLVTNPVSVGGAIFYGMAALNTYAMLAWMPTIFRSVGFSETEAAVPYSIYTFMTLPLALLTPIIASRMKRPFWLGIVFPLASAIGYLGIIVAPGAGVLWAVIAGISGGAFPFAMVMFNRRTRTPAGSAAVTGFSLGIGYALGTVGPLLGGLLSSASGSWTLPLLVFIASAAVMVLGARMLSADRIFEDSGAR
jgi:MFS transporter, CP family, cyanate transporter